MPISNRPLSIIVSQLQDYVQGTEITQLAEGYVRRMDGDIAEILLRSYSEAITLYPSVEYLKERDLDDGPNQFLKLVEYQSAQGRRMEIVRVDDTENP
jgi:hypothetical protein